MTLQFYIHSKSKRAEAIALIDSGATVMHGLLVRF